MSVGAGRFSYMSSSEQTRTAMVPIWLNRGQFTHAHAGAHAAGLLWNELVAWVRAEWAAGCSPSMREMERYAVALDRSRFPVHAHTVRAVAHDLFDAISTYRTNKRNGLEGRAPWREKQYRPLAFTRGFGWRITAEGALALSFGRGRQRILLPVPTVIDSQTGSPVPPSVWGEMTLCWDRDARAWSLRVPYTTSVAQLPQGEVGDAGTVVVGVDEGIINPLTLVVRDGQRVDGLVISGRGIRSIKRLRNKQVGSLNRAIARTKNGSRKHKRLIRLKKKTQAKTARQLRNADHHVAHRAADWINEQAIDSETGVIRKVALQVGDVRGIEKNTNKKRRASRSTRQQLSQWSRGRHETYLVEKTGLRIDYIPEPHTSQTCPACSTRRKPSGRVYACKACGLVMNRDIVGAGNILSRAVNGGDRASAISPWIDDSSSIAVKYRRSQRGWPPDQTARHSFHQNAQQRAGGRWGEKTAVEAQNRASAEIIGTVAEEQLVSQPTVTLRGRGHGHPSVPAQIPA
jgi:putative transposase